MLILGNTPDKGRVIVVPGQEWRCGLQAVTPEQTPQPWPGTVNAQIQWQTLAGAAPLPWAATIDGTDPTILRWLIPTTTVTSVIAATPSSFWLVVDGTRWVEGKLVIWNG